MDTGKKIKVLIVDDSAVVRQSLSTILQSDPQIEVIGTASDPIIAVRKLQLEVPDVITLDIEMPRMDGLTFLQKIMSQHPIPVVVISSLTARGTETAMKALQYGASEIIAKPAMVSSQFFNESKIMLCDAVKAASQAKLKRLRTNLKDDTEYTIQPKYSADVILERGNLQSHIIDTDKIIVLGASTGGTEAIRYLLRELPARMPGIAIVQHMPEGFTKSFANGLNNTSAMEVKEAEDGDKLYQGRVLIAPGNKHLLLKRTGKEYSVEVKDGPLVNRHRPAVDVLFRSAARYAGKNALGILLTGMGADGAKGLLELKETGAFTIAQDQQSSIVFGMPKEAIQLGAAEKVLGLSAIAPFIVDKFHKR
jgi:two-component system chemotaxis response regulator CheB